MKITMLGNSGSGKTSYLSVIGDLFYHSSFDGFYLTDRTDDSKKGLAFRSFNNISSLNQGAFPDGTFSNTVIPVTLTHKGNKLIDIDLIDYKGGSIDKLASQENMQASDSEVEAILLASHAILVFVDAAMLNECGKNISLARKMLGADTITELLSRLFAYNQDINLIFLLTKCDSSNIKKDEGVKHLISLIPNVYNRIYSTTGRTDFPIIPVGTVGKNNVTTRCFKQRDDVGKVSVAFTQEIVDPFAIEPFGVAESFAQALLSCLELYRKQSKNEMKKNAERLAELQKMTMLQEIFDILFRKSSNRLARFDIECELQERNAELEHLSPYQAQLRKIAKHL